MALSTFSVFYFGLKIDATNNKIDFNDGAATITSTIPSGTYSFQGLFNAIQNEMNADGASVYTVTITRATRIVNIASTGGTFELEIATGPSAAVSPRTLLGFPAADQTGATDYDGTSVAGEEYLPQFILQDYVAPEDSKQRRSPSVNESASGVVEVVSFGIVRFIEMSFKFITDRVADGKLIKNNQAGVVAAQNFFTKITERGVFEFMPDTGDRSTFFSVIVESLPGNNTGTGYKLVELTGQNLPGYYELNAVKLRVVE